MANPAHYVIIDHNPFNQIKNDSFNKVVLMTNLRGLRLIHEALEQHESTETTMKNLKASLIQTIEKSLNTA